MDYNSHLLLDKLNIDDNENNEKMRYINSAKDKLLDLQKSYNNHHNLIAEKMTQFIAVKNTYLNEISDHYNRIISLMENKKAELVFKMEKFSKEKLTQ